MIGTIDPADYEIGKVPGELVQQPLPLIFFTGLDVTSNPVHNYVWENFAIKRATDRTPLHYRLMDNDCVIPPSKQKKSSYDWYVPKGILKTNWLIKHLHEVPAVVVLCIELDWDDVNFNEKKLECVAQVEHLRNQFINRSCRIALVLLQKSLTIPIEDALTTERASNLCDSCDINAKSLFALPYQDSQHFLGYIYRMESAFCELACAYYQQEMKFIRSHKEQLNKTNHSLLFVRHQFKLGFFSEMRQDFQGAIKNYKQAYANLLEIRSSMTNIYEIMTIAGFINYKVCRLLFAQNDPREAISHFQKHINIFRSKDETPELQFEHFAWLSKQFSIFGDLFEGALGSGLVPSQIQHPGYYYYEAALLSIKRRNAIDPYREKVNYVDRDTALFIIEGALRIEFYGQRPWRPGCQSLNPLDPEREREGIEAFQYHEVNYINHSTLIINLLKNAMSQFKKNKCPRMMRFMIVLVGRQYYDAKDYTNCLNYLNQVLPFYRLEKWKQILVSILVTAFYSAYLSANVSEFIKLGLEFISSWIPTDDQFKSSIQESVIRVLGKEVPLQLAPMETYEWERINNLWSAALADGQHDSHITFKMNPIVPFIEIKPVFSKKVYDWQETINLKVYMLLNCPQAMQFSKLSLIFNEYYYNQFCEISHEQRFTAGGDSCHSLAFEPREMKYFEFNFVSRPQDSGKQLKIMGISITLGTHAFKVICNWIFEDPTDQSKCFSHNSCLHSSSSQSKFYHISPNLVTSLERRKPNVSLSLVHETPTLLNEIHPIKIVLKNEDTHSIHDVTINVVRMEESSDAPVNNFILDGQPLSLGVTQKLTEQSVLPQTSFKKIIYLPCSDHINQRFLFTISFAVDSTENEANSTLGPNILKEIIYIQTVSPFSVNFSTCNPLNLPARALRLMEPFILKAEIQSLSPFPLELVDNNLELNENFFHLIPHSPTSLNKTLRQEEKLETHFVLYSDSQITEATNLGQFVLRWRKSQTTNDDDDDDDDGENQVNLINFTLPQVTVQNSLLYVETLLPEFGVTRQSLMLTYNLYNRTDDLLPIHFSLGKSDNFMFAGNSSIKLTLPAKSKSTQVFVLYPLVCGQVSLPKLRILAYPDAESPIPMDDVLDDIVPSYLRVMVNNLQRFNQQVSMGNQFSILFEV